MYSYGIPENERYILYGDSYKLDKVTGFYTIYNKDGSSLKTLSYKDNIDALVGKYTDDLSKDINDNILEVLKIYGYDVSTWYVHEVRTGANGIPHTIDVPPGYIISWKV
jgi:hypothetical protein